MTLFLERRGPVDDDGQRRGRSSPSVDQDPLPVLGPRVHFVGAHYPSGEKRRRQPGRGRGGEVDRHRRHRPCRIEIEQLSTIGPPMWISSPIRRDAMFSPGAKKWLNVDVGLAGFVGRIRDPSTVRGKHSLPLDELRIYHWKRFAVPTTWKGPELGCEWNRPADG